MGVTDSTKFDELDLRIRFAIAKGRNIIYYRLIDDRPRGQYIHVMRKYRQELFNLNRLLKNESRYQKIYELFNRLIALIPPKIKSEGCFEVIMEMNKILNYE